MRDARLRLISAADRVVAGRTGVYDPPAVAGDEHAWDARVVATSRDAASVFVRSHRFEVGVPLSFDREEPRVTALEQALGALGADLVLGLWGAARRRRLVLDSVEATVRAILENPLVTLRVVGETGTPAIRRIRVRAYATTAEPPETVEAAWREAIETSPLAATLARACDLDLSVKTQV